MRYWQHERPLRCPEGHPMLWLGSVYWICGKGKCNTIFVQEESRNREMIIRTTIQVSDDPDTTFTIDCVVCDKPQTLTLKSAALRAWQDGMHIQTVFPELTPDQGELMISGICGTCFDQMFGDQKDVMQV